MLGVTRRLVNEMKKTDKLINHAASSDQAIPWDFGFNPHLVGFKTCFSKHTLRFDPQWVRPPVHYFTLSP